VKAHVQYIFIYFKDIYANLRPKYLQCKTKITI